LSVLTQVGQLVGRDAIADRCEKTFNSIGVVVIPLSSSEPVRTDSADWGTTWQQRPKEPLTTEAIEILERILKNWCDEYGCETGSRAPR
ncbi:hypothetical protein ACC760_38090, partial [Rhizobium ruizarguesonis]